MSSVFPRLPGFRVLEQLGSGPSGLVLRAHDENRGHEVALKLLDPRRTSARHLDDLADLARRLFYTPFSLACEVYEVIPDPVQPFLVMQLLRGETLADKLAATGPFSWRTARSYGDRIAAAVEAAHERDIVHGAVKPNNAMFCADFLYVLDFGLGAYPDISDPSVMLPAADYLSPEQLRGEPPTVKSDLYSLGLLFFEMLTGRLPFTGRPEDVAAKHLLAPPPRPRGLVRGLHPSVEALILDLLAKDPRRRPASIAELRERLPPPEPDPMDEQATIAWSRPPGASNATISLPSFASHPDPNATVFVRPPAPAGSPAPPRAPAPDRAPWSLETRLLAAYLALASLLLIGLLGGACDP